MQAHDDGIAWERGSADTHYQGATAMQMNIRLEGCSHVPRAQDVREEFGVYRSVCRRCECNLVRTLASRKWYRSGLFG